MGVDVGERIASVREISAAMGMSVGAISTALNSMQDAGCISFEKRGHMGSYLAERSIGALWGMLEKGPLVVATSLPMHIRFEGLATAVKKNLESAGIETYLIFVRGSNNRLKALHNHRCHAVLMSKFSAEEREHSDNEILYELPSGTWLSGYGVYYRRDIESRQGPLRVGIDYQSYDNHRLAAMEFEGQQIKEISVSYVHVAQLLRNNEIDTFVWNTDQMSQLESPEVAYRPLSDTVLEKVGTKPLDAVFIGNKGDRVISTVLRECMHADELISLQNKVVNREILPNY